MDLITDLFRLALLVFVGGLGLLVFVTGRLVVSNAPAPGNRTPHGMG
jgi:hypothetical protein